MLGHDEILEKAQMLGKTPNPYDEKNFIIRLIQSSLPKLYILSFDWASNYTRYLIGEQSQVREIKNDWLMMPDGTLNPDRKQDVDYVLVNHQVW